MLPQMKMMTPTERLFRRPNQSDVLRPVRTSLPSLEGVTRGGNFSSLSTRQGTDERSDRHQRDEKRFEDRHECVGSSWRLGLARRESVPEVGEDEHTGDLSGVVTEKKATDRGDDTQEDRFGTAVGAVDADGPGEVSLSVSSLLLDDSLLAKTHLGRCYR